MLDVEASAGILTFDDVVCLASEGILRRLLRTRGLAAPESAEPSVSEDARAVTRPWILVVEDEPQLLEVMRLKLERWGYRVATARNGDEAMVEFARTEFAVVVTDLAMPGLSGLEVARRCKEARPGVAVVMVTAWETLLTDDDVTKYGVDRVLAKPLLGDTLLEAITDVTRRS